MRARRLIRKGCGGVVFTLHSVALGDGLVCAVGMRDEAMTA